jgi:broad specificity phosphatase PhoE
MVARFEDAYDAMGILDGCVPPAALVRAALEADVVVASDLPRALASAERLARGRAVVTSPLLREIRVEPPRWIPIALPLAAWEALNHLQWSFRLLVRADHDSMRRAAQAADWLEEQTRRTTTVLVVTHGGFRRLLAARLIARGWHLARSRGPARYANWSSWDYDRAR